MRKNKKKSNTSKSITPKEGKRKKTTQFETLRHNVAGIDVSGSGGMMVAYPISETEIVVDKFECYTRDLREISATLKSHGIKSVAMESTGVYWIPLFLLLQEDGFEVYLVNAKHVKNVTGRKTDEDDAEWIQKLHRCGLLSASFQPDNDTRGLRSVFRHRDSMVKTRAAYLNRMQKSLESMNMKIQTVLSDIDGATGIRIIDAIIAGERNAERLADLCDVRVKASREEIVKSLECFWTDEHLFELEQSYDIYKFHSEKIMECDLRIEKILIEIIASKNDGVIPEIEEDKKLKPKRQYKNNISIDVPNLLHQLTGVDVCSVEGITGISGVTALGVFAEIGYDGLKRFKNEKHFTSWLGLVPNNKESAGKIISRRVPKKKHWAGQMFRMAAMSLLGNKGPLGDYYRKLRARAGAPKAIVALARKLAVTYYKMMTDKSKYNPQTLIDYQKKDNERKIKYHERCLERLRVVA